VAAGRRCGGDRPKELRTRFALRSLPRRPTFAPIAFTDADSNKQQSKKIYSFIAAQIKDGADEFVEMLRRPIKQDEWLLFLHGRRALGPVRGLRHLAIFGV